MKCLSMLTALLMLFLLACLCRRGLSFNLFQSITDPLIGKPPYNCDLVARLTQLNKTHQQHPGLETAKDWCKKKKIKDNIQNAPKRPNLFSSRVGKRRIRGLLFNRP